MPARTVRRLAQPVLLDCSTSGSAPGEAMVVVPLLENGRIVGLDVRCRCGSNVIVECVYEEPRA
jgi:hypothetical protein